MSDLLAVLEARQAEIQRARERLAREATLLREAATKLRVGAKAGVVVAELWTAGVDLHASPVAES